jgi:hypothetical protein
MAYIDAYTGMDVLTPEEEELKRKREQQLADTAVHTEERKVYGDGTQEITTKREITPEAQGIKAKPSVFENLGNAVAAMPENFVNNLKQAGQNFATNLQAAPANFAANLQQGVTNLQNAPANLAANIQAGIPTNPNQPQATPAPQPQLNFDRNAYNASIAQAESGNRADIGYHDKTKSTAFGQFGITAPAYQDARRVDPNLPEDITKATAEQQTRAQNIITDNNAKFLQQRGVEPTPGVLAAAHFTGANGLHKFLTQKDEQGRPYISPQAQVANGGYDKAAAIINARLNGQAMPSSGATQRPPQAFPQEGVAVATGQGVQGTQSMAPGPITPEQAQAESQQFEQGLQQYAQTQKPNSYDEFGTPVYSAEAAKLQTSIDRFNAAQGNYDSMMAFGSDKNEPDWMRRRTREEIADMVNKERNQSKAQEAMANLGPNDMAKVLTRPGSKEGNTVGDWLQYLLFKHVGLNDLANAKGEELGIGHKWQTAYIQDANGRDVPVEVQTSASGKLLKGNIAGTNTMLTPEQMTMAAGAVQSADALKTAQTQATHAYTSAYTSLMKSRDELIQAGAKEQDLAQRGLDMGSIQTRAQQAGKAVIDAARSQYRNQGGVGIATGMLAPGVQTGTTAPTSTAGTQPAEAQYKTASGKTSLLDNWNAFRPGEDAKAKTARTSIQPTEIDSAAQALVEGRVKPTEFTGRGSEFRRLAVERALEIDNKYTPQRYDQVNKVIQRYTSGEDHKTLINTGTAVNHLVQFKEIANNTPGNTDVSSWNTFYQNLMKYGDAPEIKSKEAMAGFVAGELVKAASGAQGSMTERIHLEQQLMKANTPSEITAIVDNSIKLAHGRYDSMRSNFIGSTGRSKQEFNDLVGMPADARKAFDKIDAQHAVKEQGSEAEKWARANPDDPRSKDILKRLGKQ